MQHNTVQAAEAEPRQVQRGEETWPCSREGSEEERGFGKEKGKSIVGWLGELSYENEQKTLTAIHPVHQAVVSATMIAYSTCLHTLQCVCTYIRMCITKGWRYHEGTCLAQKEAKGVE